MSSEFDIDQWIICQKKSKVSLTSTEMVEERSSMLLLLAKMKYINDFKMVLLTEILNTTSIIPA